MKTFLRNLVLAILFVAPVYGQVASTLPQMEHEDSKSPAVILKNEPPVTSGVDAHDSNLGFPLFRTIGGLGLVLCLMTGGYFAARKLAPRYFPKNASERNLKVIETLSMGDRRSISMIEVGASRFLIGNTPQQINLLAALPEPLSAVSEPEALPVISKGAVPKESMIPFRNLFEVEKKRSAQFAGNPLPEDIRAKMRQLRASLER
jgi:flagellar biogenesis protein FliO